MNQYSISAKKRVQEMPWTIPDNNGERNGMWQGENASYQAIHTWLRKHCVKPKNCQHCGVEKRLDWASKTKEYTRDIREYIALCRGCHIRLDRYGSISV